ncbi:MAG: hypothetical protein RBQ91_04440 [Acholeplasma sp.]|nr:hypothetical protein [Acholeplasma sp.]
MKLSRYIYVLIIFFAAISMYFGIRNGLIVGGILICSLIYSMIHSNLKGNLRLNQIDILIIFFIFYNIFTGLFLLIGHLPISVFLSEIANSIIPISMYFFSKKYKFKDFDIFYKVFVISLIVVIISGLYYNLTLSDPFYLSYLERAYPNFHIIGFRLYPRLTSWIGSVAIGVLSLGGLLLTYYRLSISAINKKIGFSLVTIFTISILLSMQRSAIFALVFILLYIVKRVKVDRLFTFRNLSFFFVISTFMIGSFVVFYPEFTSSLFDRFSNIFTAISERNLDWLLVFDNNKMLLFGNGLGSGGHRAIEYQEIIADGNYFKMLYEIGIFGIITFIVIIINVLFHKIPSKKATFKLAILIFLFQAIGSNVLTFQISAILFWFYIGLVYNKNLDSLGTKNYEKDNSI